MFPVPVDTALNQKPAGSGVRLWIPAELLPEPLTPLTIIRAVDERQATATSGRSVHERAGQGEHHESD